MWLTGTSGKQSEVPDFRNIRSLRHMSFGARDFKQCAVSSGDGSVAALSDRVDRLPTASQDGRRRRRGGGWKSGVAASPALTEDGPGCSIGVQTACRRAHQTTASVILPRTSNAPVTTGPSPHQNIEHDPSRRYIIAVSNCRETDVGGMEGGSDLKNMKFCVCRNLQNVRYWSGIGSTVMILERLPNSPVVEVVGQSVPQSLRSQVVRHHPNEGRSCQRITNKL